MFLWIISQSLNIIFKQMNEGNLFLVSESDRKSLRPGQRLHAGMISGPQNDLRHMGHVGHDGVMFGDVSCLDQKKQERWLSKGIHSG